jgi:small-conductance mechanosensitive channel
VYLRLTDNWVELALRFVVPVHGVRAIKDAMNREILAEFRGAGLEIASTTYDIVGLPPLRVDRAPA